MGYCRHVLYLENQEQILIVHFELCIIILQNKFWHDIFGRISCIYAIETSSGVFVFRGTVTKYDVHRQMIVSAYLCPSDEIGSGLIQFMAHLVNGT